MAVIKTVGRSNQKPLLVRLRNDLNRNKYIYLLLLPTIIYFLVFHYYPMYGAQIAFKNFRPGLGIEGSPWVGLKHFISFFNGSTRSPSA